MDIGQEVTPNGRVIRRKVAAKPKFSLAFVEGDWHLADVWEFVKLGLEEILTKAKGYYTWRPEDVYLALRLKKANLYLAHWEGQLKGFGVVQQNVDVFGNARPHLLSWAGYCTHRETRVAYFQELKIIAKSFKLGEVRHASTRHGWLIDPPWGAETETLTAQGWLKNLTRDQIHRMSLAPEIFQRTVVE